MKLRVLAFVALVSVSSGCRPENRVTNPTDRQPPARVTDLIARSVGSSSVRLEWTAVGDDSTTGTAAVYDLRYADSEATGWEQMYQVSAVLGPGASGSPELYTVEGLAPDTGWYFRLQVSDEALNWSALSNIASARTMAVEDTIPPPPVTTLLVDSWLADSVTFHCVWPIIPCFFDLRYSDSPITEGNWIDAVPVLADSSLGGTATFGVSGLPTRMDRHFAVKYRGTEARLWSPISNVVQVNLPRQTLLMDQPTEDESPLWSSDAAAIAYRAYDGHRCMLRVMPSDGGHPIDLAIVNCGGGPMISWSPVESRIAYASDFRGIWVVSASGGGETQLTSGHDDDPEWSPDGSRIAFSSFQDDVWNVWVVPSSGGDPARLTSFREHSWSPQWSPDGEWLAFSSGDSIYVVSPAGGDPVSISSGRDPRWSPDGTKILYSSGGFICVVPATGGEGARLAAGHSPRWSPAGDRIAFIAFPDGEENLYVMPLGGGTPIQLTNVGWHLGRVEDPAWSPDGSTIAFASRPGRPGDDDFDLWMVEVE